MTSTIILSVCISIYLDFLFSAVTNLISINFGIIPVLYMEVKRLEETVVYCKIQSYVLDVALQISRYMILMACFDRYALCSANASIRKFCSVRIARRYVVPLITFIWLLIPLHIPIFITFQDAICAYPDSMAQYDSIYGIVMGGIIPPSLMFISSLFIFHNLKLRQKRRQVHPFIVGDSIQSVNENQRSRIKDKQVLAMLLVQVFAYVISSTPYTIALLYVVLIRKTFTTIPAEEESIIAFILFITMMLRFVCPFISFYLFLFVSPLYRREMLLIILNFYRRISTFLTRDDYNNHHHHVRQITQNVSSIRRGENRLQQNHTTPPYDAAVQ